MKDLKVEDLNKLKKDNFSVLMLWANGCPYCISAKEKYNEIEKSFNKFDFYRLEMNNDVLDKFYKKIEQPDTPMQEPVLDKDGNHLIDFRGVPLYKTKFENGKPILIHNVTVPKFYVFHGEEVSDENELGLLGKIEGSRIDELNTILKALNEQA